LNTLTAEIHEAADHTFNIDSTQQLATVLFDEQGLDVVRKTKTGRSTDAETLSTLAASSTNKIPVLILEYRELKKLRGTYVETLPTMVSPKTRRIHASFNQTGAVTGRLSSNSPNLQNIPIRTETGQKIRSAFVAGEDGHVLMAADYSQIELRILAHLCEDERLQQAFRSGQDIHAFVASQVNRVPIDEVTKEQRSAAKAINFGIIYGQTPFGLSRALHVPVAEAKAFIDTYFLRYPGIRWFIDRCIEQAKSKGYAETMHGRRRPVDELRSRNRQHVAFGERIAVNTVVQGTAADMIKLAMIDIHREIQSQGLPLKMLIQVHDELVFEAPASGVEELAEIVRRKMSTAVELNVPIVVDINWGPSWLEGK
jgi:DNA polymerase I